jgi:hypothetical protein
MNWWKWDNAGEKVARARLSACILAVAEGAFMTLETLAYRAPRASRFGHYYLVHLAWTVVPWLLLVVPFLVVGLRLRGVFQEFKFALPAYTMALLNLGQLCLNPFVWPALVIPPLALAWLPTTFAARANADGRMEDLKRIRRHYLLLLLVLHAIGTAILCWAFFAPLVKLGRSISDGTL